MPHPVYVTEFQWIGMTFSEMVTRTRRNIWEFIRYILYSIVYLCSTKLTLMWKHWERFKFKYDWMTDEEKSEEFNTRKKLEDSNKLLLTIHETCIKISKNLKIFLLLQPHSFAEKYENIHHYQHRNAGIAIFSQWVKEPSTPTENWRRNNKALQLEPVLVANIGLFSFYVLTESPLGRGHSRSRDSYSSSVNWIRVKDRSEDIERGTITKTWSPGNIPDVIYTNPI